MLTILVIGRLETRGGRWLATASEFLGCRLKILTTSVFPGIGPSFPELGLR